GNPYKQEWLNQIGDRDEKILIYWTADKFVDLCAGPHVKSTGEIKAFKLLSIAGAYWHGDEKNKMLTRIYGTAFPSKKELKQYLHNLKEAKKRDHRKLGKQLDLFSFHKEGPGFVFWHPKGYQLYQNLVEYWRKIHKNKDYVEIKTPTLLTIPVWQKSGHMENFIDKMYLAQTGDSKKSEYAIKPMNCDGGMLVYSNNPHSYKELPIRMGELGVVHRYESSGEMHGLMRVREFTQDDAHIYCTQNQVKDELRATIALCKEIYKTCDLPLNHIELSTRPKKSIGSNTIWEKAETTMKEILKKDKIEHRINEGDGAFYGPKFDFHLKDCLGRTFQCGTIQLDFAQPNNFDLIYTDQNGQKKRPVMIHRTIYGSMERFIGLLIEHFAGAFPVWLSPIQAKIIPITDKQNDYAKKIAKRLKEKDIRVELDDRSETMQNKIRLAQTEKIPYMLIIGQREADSSSISVRQRNGQDLGSMPLEQFIKKITIQILQKSLNLIK
ncbi:threonine--tRNA ligase, partial [Patescibacteria group bacterium]|nr:threonine--tRNA ligase [Patescibacteria group bacterium]